MGGERRIPRRAVLATGLAAVSLAGCDAQATTGGDVPEPDPLAPAPPATGLSRPGSTPVARPGDRTTVLHVVAHPDDDLFFINPEIAQSIAAGHRVVGVCVTAAEADGRDGPHARHADLAGYVRARQNALRAAYAQMLRGDPAAAWSTAVLRMPNGALAQADTLGRVTLVFLDVRKTGAGGRLRHLWSGRADALWTLPAAGSPVQVHRYGRSELIDALVLLLDTFRPTLVRTMDPDPDLQAHNRLHRRHSDFGDFSDHQDHTATAQFTWAALARYQGPGGGRTWTAESFRGYYNCRWPFDLSGPAWAAKRAVLDIYSGDTPVHCDLPDGCADLTTHGRIAASGWGQSTHERYVSTAPALVRTAGGALAAFGVVAGQAAVWTGTGGRWSGPRPLGGGQLVPRLSPAVTPDGRWHLAGERIDELGPGDRDRARSVVVLDQDGGWQDLGRPDHGRFMRQTGVPLLVARRDGELQVFVRTADRTPATRVRAAGAAWSPWLRLGGPPVQEGLAALACADGRIELYGLGALSVVRWFQRRPGGPFLLDTGLRTAPPGTPPYALECADGTVLVLFRTAGNGQLTAIRRRPGAASFGPQYALGGQGGLGPVQALQTADGALLLLQRNDAGTLSTARTGVTATEPPVWTPAGPLLAHAPSMALDGSGRPVAAGLTPAATLRVLPLDQPGPAATLSAAPPATLSASAAGNAS